MDYFRQLLDLLKIEREEDRKLYKEQFERLPVADRRDNGLTWYPVAIRDTELTRGDYLSVELERTTHQDVIHQFRSGASARLFSNHDPGHDYVEGVISWQGVNRMKLVLRTDELPDWTRNGKLGIDLLFDENSYEEMQQTLRLAGALMEKTREGQLIRILTGSSQPGFDPPPAIVHTSHLNSSQQAAVAKILSANDLAIVHGPPGTGKTTTLVQAIKAMMDQNPQQILVTAPSNAAVDWLSEKLSEQGLNVLRIGNPARVSERLLSLTLDNKMAEHPSTKEIKRLKKQANEFRDMAHKYKRHFGKAEREQRKALFTEARNIMQSVEQTEQYIISDLLNKAQVITATLVGSNHTTIRERRFQTVVIDEAGQALEPACWIPILKAQRVIMAGDHCQLPPTVKSMEAARGGLTTTLMEKTVALHPQAVTLLEEQYRMNNTIMGFSSREFYDNRLHAHPSVAQRLLYPGDQPLLFIDTAGCGYEEKAAGNSISNPEEAAFLFRHLTHLVQELETNKATPSFPTIAVISPYRRQIELMKEMLEQSPALLAHGKKIAVNTIDSFQGQERDIVYIGLARSNPEGNIGFLTDIRRMNVAMTRARKKLVIIGDSATLSQFPFYADFIEYAEANAGYISAWEFAHL